MGLKSSFAKCITSPELEEERKKNLRFAVGDSVECSTTTCTRSDAWVAAGKQPGWEKGKIVALRCREEFMPDGIIAPYQVKLDKGDLIFAPFDGSDVIRKAD